VSTTHVITGEQGELLSLCLGIWFNTRATHGKPTIDEAIDTFIECEQRANAVVIHTNKQLNRILLWLIAKDMIA
jgi:hypothetical protein